MLPKKKPQPDKPKSKQKFHRLRHPFMIPVLTFFVFFFLGIVLFINQNGQTVGASDSRIVILTDNGLRQVIPTTAPTVGNLLARLNIKINPGDVVNPSLSTPILQNNFNLNIYRVHPVTVIENGQKTIVSTAQYDPRVIAEQAGYTLYPQDYVTTSSDADNLGQDVLGQEVDIVPATPVSLNLYGSSVTQRTHATTVAQLLADDKIKTSAGNNVLPALTTPITPNLQILVVPVGQNLISSQQVLPFATQIVNNPTLPYGQVQITQAGVNGLALVVKDIDAKTGTAVNNQLQQVIISQPVTEIIQHGTGITAIAGGNNITWLKSSNISVSDYSYVNEVINTETHWNPDDINGSGCIGLGQSCPGSSGVAGLAVVCPDWQSDAVCQLGFFNNYAVSRYGSWAAAAAHENDYGWW